MIKKLLARTGAALLRAAAPDYREMNAPAMMRLLRPEVRDRWRLARVANYTPDRVEMVLRGAFAGDLCAQWELFDLMEETWPRLMKNLGELKGALSENEWALQAWAPEGEEPSPEAERRKRLLEQAIWHMEPDPTLDENDWEATLVDLADAWGKGVSVLEMHWAPRAYEGGSLIGLRATHWVHPRYYGWPTAGGRDVPDRLMLRTRELPPGWQQVWAQSGTVENEWMPFPQDKFLTGIAKHKTGHPIGASLLRPLAWWWCSMNFASEWMLNLAQIFGVPMRWATYADGTPQQTVATIEEMLSEMGSSSWAAFPEGTTLELKEGPQHARDNPQKVIYDTADRVCDLLILGQTLTSDVQESGSRALGDVHADVLEGRKRALVSWVAKTLNQQFVPAFCRLNFGDTRECPYFMVGDKSEEDAKSLAERDQILIGLGTVMPRSWFYERHKIPLPASGDEVVGTGAVQVVNVDDELTEEEEMEAVRARMPVAGRVAIARAVAAQAKTAQEKLTDAVLEELTGVEARWLSGVRPFFRKLIVLAQSRQISDGEFIEALERARRQIPELFDRLDTPALQKAMERAMGAAMVNGAVEGFLDRGRK